MNDPHGPPPVIEVAGLSRRFGEQLALDDVTLSVPTGAVLGLVGENGAGKTTLLRHLLGLLAPQQGSVRVFGRDPVADPAGVLGRTGYLSEDRDLPLWMRVGELLNYWSAFYPNWDRGYADELLELFDLAPQQRLQTLSRGQLARTGLLLAVAHRPQLLLLDEPSSGLDPVVRQDILAAIIRTVSEEGRTVVFSSHLLDEVQRVSDHLVLLHRGKVKLAGRLDAILEAYVRRDIRLPQDGPPQAPGAVRCVGEGRQWTLICEESNDLRSWLQQQNAEVLDQSPATLDEVFVALGSGAERGAAQT